MPQLALLAIALACALDAWAAPKYKILHGFTGGKDGGNLQGSLTLDAHGNVYGATFLDTIFELSPRGGGKWHFRLLLTLDDGSGANGSLLLDTAGDLYGTTQACCPSGYGEVFELSPGSRGWKETVIHRFGQDEHAGAPWDGPIMDSAGNLYGTAGSAYELTLGPDGWEFANLHEFPSHQGDGSDPYAGVIMDSHGNLYGTTQHGGSSSDCGDGCGTVYELSPQGDGKWKETILHSFGAFDGDGAFPGAGALAMDGSGRLYGTTGAGGHGQGQCGGTIFMLTPDAGGKWKESILYGTFGEGVGGCEPAAGVVLDKAGNLYGTTIAGGSGCDCGVVYKLSPSRNGKWKYTVLHTFQGYDGAQPDANLVLDVKGNLYGTTATGGPGGYGVAFELTP